MTVLEVYLEVLKESGQLMTVKQIISEIEAHNLYVFKAKYPAKVVSSAIRHNLSWTAPLWVHQST